MQCSVKANPQCCVRPLPGIGKKTIWRNSTPIFHIDGELAQLGAHLLCKQGVVGSSPIFSTSHRDVGCKTRCLGDRNEFLVANTWFESFATIWSGGAQETGNPLPGREVTTTAHWWHKADEMWITPAYTVGFLCRKRLKARKA